MNLSQGGDQMDTVSFWESITKRSTHYPELTQNMDVDVVVIGGGITGVTTALQLIQAGKKVAILEAKRMGGVTTGYSTGNLYVAVQPYFQNIVSKFNLETAKQIAHSRKFAIDYIEKNINDKKIDCQFFRRPWYLYTEEEEKISFLEKEIETFKKMEIQINETESLPVPLSFKKAAVMPDQARFNPLQYVISLAEYLSEKGCEIFENSRVLSIDEKNDRCELTTSKAKIKAKHCVIATHTPIGVNLAQMYTAPYRSYVVAVTLKDKNYPEGQFWNLKKPHYAVCTHAITKNHPELLMVAGSHHKVGQDKDAESHFGHLEKFLRKNFSVDEIAYRWSAQHYHSADDVPYIGLASRFAKNSYIATGYFADGLVYGTLAGVVIADLILKKENALSDVYQSNRCKPLASAGFLLREDTNVFWQYLKDFPFTTTSDIEKIKPGDGQVVVIEGEKYGVYRDEKNKLHTVSAVCTHMKCIVNFNNAEKTWDCPCHGSRFTTQGKVIEGPAIKDLKKIVLKEKE
jgi:glycine/D-amino acid oxidase-like deaminating enzyme/nitrite reductase/ring-hydroxylating ferredoxin subunit